MCVSFIFFTDGSAPVIENHWHDRTVDIGSTGDLHCLYTSDWPVNVSWILETSNANKTIDISQEPVLYSEENKDKGGGKFDTKVKFLSLNNEDLGTYKCRIENQFGVAIGPSNLMERNKGIIMI